MALASPVSFQTHFLGVESSAPWVLLLLPRTYCMAARHDHHRRPPILPLNSYFRGQCATCCPYRTSPTPTVDPGLPLSLSAFNETALTTLPKLCVQKTPPYGSCQVEINSASCAIHHALAFLVQASKGRGITPGRRLVKHLYADVQNGLIHRLVTPGQNCSFGSSPLWKRSTPFLLALRVEHSALHSGLYSPLLCPSDTIIPR